MNAKTKFRILSCAVVLFMMAPLALFQSCGEEESSNQLRFVGQDTVEYNAQNVTLRVLSEGSWTVSARDESGTGSGWFTLGQSSGNGLDNVIIRLTQNDGDLRSMMITVDFGTEAKNIRLVQREFYDESTQVVRDWFELPAGYDDGASDAVVVAHYVPEKRDVRSFTVRYNTSLFYAEWVAYPMHISYHRPSYRSDLWAFDPKVPRELQADVTGYFSNYQRGHMLPSRSRTVNAGANEQTFYSTNINPQRGSLNENIWENLESRVREWTGNGNDTLYVVTGAVLSRDGYNESHSWTTSSNDRNKQIAVPNYFYKALVRRTASPVSYKGIAFWFDKYGSDRNVAASDAISIDELETRTGLTFFPQLPAAVADEVKGGPYPAQWGL